MARIARAQQVAPPDHDVRHPSDHDCNHPVYVYLRLNILVVTAFASLHLGHTIALAAHTLRMIGIMHSLVVYALILVFTYPTAFLLRSSLSRIGALNESSNDDFEEQPEEHQPEQPRKQVETQLREPPEEQAKEQPQDQPRDQPPRLVRRWVLPSSENGRPLDRHLCL